MKKAASGRSLTWEIFDLINSIQGKGLLDEYYSYVKSTKSKNVPKIYKAIFDVFLQNLNDVDFTVDIPSELEDKINTKIDSKDKSKAKQQLKEKLIEFITWHYKKTNELEYQIDTLLWEAKALSTQGFSRTFFESKMLEADTKLKEYISIKKHHIDTGIFSRYVEQYQQAFRDSPNYEEIANTSYNRLLILLNHIYRYTSQNILNGDIQAEKFPYMIYDIVGKYCSEKSDIEKQLKLINQEIEKLHSENRTSWNKNFNDIRVAYLETEKIILSYRLGHEYRWEYTNDDDLINKTLGFFVRLILKGTEEKLFFTKNDYQNISERLELNRIIECCYFAEVQEVLKLTKEVLNHTKDLKLKTKLLLIELICEMKLKNDNDYIHTHETIKRIKSENKDEFDKTVVWYLENKFLNSESIRTFKEENKKFENPFALAIFELLGR